MSALPRRALRRLRARAHELGQVVAIRREVRHAARVAVLRAGELLFAGPPAEYEREFAEDVFA